MENVRSCCLTVVKREVETVPMRMFTCEKVHEVLIIYEKELSGTAGKRRKAWRKSSPGFLQLYKSLLRTF